jgi:hypothetical protein
MIWNKSLSVHTLIYDMARNILFEDDDITVHLLDDEGMDEFLLDAREKVKKKSSVQSKNKDTEKKQAEQLGIYDDFEDCGPYCPFLEMHDQYETGGKAWRL